MSRDDGQRIPCFDRCRFDDDMDVQFQTCENYCSYKQLLEEVFVISGIIKVEVSVIITLTSTLIIRDITKTSSNNCFIIHCFEETNDKRIVAAITV